MENKKPPGKSFTWIVVLIVAVSMLLANLLIIYSASRRGYLVRKTGFTGIILLADVFIIAVCLAIVFYENRQGKGK
jgi:uncharacterized membrane protein